MPWPNLHTLSPPRVARRRAARADQGDRTRVGQALGVADGQVLDTHYHCDGRASRDRSTAGYPPADDRAGQDVDDEGLVAEAGPGPRRTCRGRAEAQWRPLDRPVSPARPPNRTCDSHRIRLSTSSDRGCWRTLCSARPGGRDPGAPVAIANDRDRSWPEHLGPPVADLPALRWSP